MSERQISVFMCDDSSALRALVGLQLEHASEIELIGGSGDPGECLREVAQRHPDVVLLDHGMVPATDPAGYVAQLRSASPTARVVLFSGMPREMLEAQAARLGADAHVHKAASGDELGRTLKALVAPG